MSDSTHELPVMTRVIHKGTGERGTVSTTGTDDRGQWAGVAWDNADALELPHTVHTKHLERTTGDDSTMRAVDVQPGDLLRGSDAGGEDWHTVTSVTVEGDHVVIGFAGREDARLSAHLAVAVRRGGHHEAASYAFPLPACRAHTFQWEDGERDTCYRCGAARPGVGSMPDEGHGRGVEPSEFLRHYPNVGTL